jgi:hypothetical protein
VAFEVVAKQGRKQAVDVHPVGHRRTKLSKGAAVEVRPLKSKRSVPTPRPASVRERAEIRKLTSPRRLGTVAPSNAQVLPAQGQSRQFGSHRSAS